MKVNFLELDRIIGVLAIVVDLFTECKAYRIKLCHKGSQRTEEMSNWVRDGKEGMFYGLLPMTVPLAVWTLAIQRDENVWLDVRFNLPVG